MRVPLPISGSILAILVACSSTAPDLAGPADPPGEATWNGLSIAVEAGVADVVPRTLRAGATVTNVDDEPRRIEYGDCAITLLAYVSPDREAEPVWASTPRWAPMASASACQLYLASRDLAPGETFAAREFSLRIPLYQIVGDGLGGDPPLEPGRYHLSAVLRLDGAFSPEIPLGAVDLPAAVDPVPGVSEVEGVAYAAEARRLSRDSLMFRLSLTNRRSTPVEVGTSSGEGVPIPLSGYESPRRRDTWYRHRSDDWAGSWRAVLPAVTLAPGETRVVERRAGMIPPEEPVHLLASLRIEQDGELWFFVLAPGTIE